MTDMNNKNDEDDAIMNDVDIVGDMLNNLAASDRERREMRFFCTFSFLLACISLFVVIPIVVSSTRNNDGSETTVPLRFEDKDIWYPLGDKIIGFEGGEEFGESIDLSGDGVYLAIGSNNMKIAQGKVEVRMYSGTDWRQVGNVIEGNFRGENFGHAVQLSSDGGILVASGFGTKTNILNTTEEVTEFGNVRSYTFNANMQRWIQSGNDIAGDRRKGDRFGISLSMASAGNAWIVGTDNPDIDNKDCCYAVVYELSRFGNWIQKGEKIMGAPRDETAAGSSNGYATAMSGDGNTVCVGDHWHLQRGRVRCFQWKKMTFYGGEGPKFWLPVGMEILGTVLYGQMGYSLSLNYDGTRVAVGNRVFVNNGDDDKRGSVGVYRLENPGTNNEKWTIMGKEQMSTQAGDQGGFQVQLNAPGDVLAWSARGFDDHDNATTTTKKKNVGMVRISYWSENTAWIPLDNDHVLGDSENDYFGESIALSDTGTIFAASSNLNAIEYVRAYTLM